MPTETMAGGSITQARRMGCPAAHSMNGTNGSAARLVSLDSTDSTNNTAGNTCWQRTLSTQQQDHAAQEEQRGKRVVSAGNGWLRADDRRVEGEDSRGQGRRPARQSQCSRQGVHAQRHAQMDQQIGDLPADGEVKAVQLVVERVGEHGDGSVVACRLLDEMRIARAYRLLKGANEIGQVLHAIGAQHRPPVRGHEANLQKLRESEEDESRQHEWWPQVRPPRRSRKRRCAGCQRTGAGAIDAQSHDSRLTRARRSGLNISRTTYCSRDHARTALS